MISVVGRRMLTRRTPCELISALLTRSLSQSPTPISANTSHSNITEYNKELSKISANEGHQVEVLLHTKLKSPSITTLAELVKYSADLQSIVSLGVSLRQVEEVDGASDLLANVKYYPHLHDIVTLLKAVGVEEVGSVITKCPFILGEDAETIKLKLVYLSSRRFTRSQIANIITKQPKWLLENLSEVDAKLAAVQQVFHLTNKDLRDVVSRSPKMALVNTLILHQFKYMMSGAYDCDEQMLKKIVIGCPAAAYVYEPCLKERMDFLTQTMQLGIEQVAAWPSILRCRLRILKQRHLVLRQINMAEYDNTKPGYISLQKLVSGKDSDFCEKVANIPLQLYYDYLKTF